MAEFRLHDLLDLGDQIVVVAGADDLADGAEMLVLVMVDDGRRYVDRMDLVINVVALAIEDHPLIADKDPGIDAIGMEDIDRLARDLRRDAHLLDHGQIGLDDRPAIVAAERQRDLQRVAHRRQAEGRPAAADRKPDTALVQFAHGGDGGGAQRLFGGNEGAIDIGDDELDLAHKVPRSKISTPPSEATMTADVRSIKSPLSTTPTVILTCFSSFRGSVMRAKRQSRM